MLSTEIEFHNKRAKKESAGGGRLSKVYESMANALSLPRDMLPKDATRVLEIGSYLGENSTGLHSDVNYTGIDISDAAVDYANSVYSNDNVKFRCMDAHKLADLQEKYDYIYGNGILHHLRLEEFVPSLVKVLDDAGGAVFLEPNAGPPWLRLFRYLTPWLRSPDEHPLIKQDYDLLEEYFDVEVNNFGLLCPLVPLMFFNSGRVIKWCQEKDVILNNTNLSKWSWLSVVVLSPRDSVTDAK